MSSILKVLSKGLIKYTGDILKLLNIFHLKQSQAAEKLEEQYKELFHQIGPCNTAFFCDFRDFPGSSVVKTPCFHCRGLRSDPWSGN